MATVQTGQLTNLFEKVIDPMLRKLHVSANKSPLVRMWKEGRNGGEGTKQFDSDTFYISVKHGRHANMQSQAEGATLLRGRSRDAQPSFQTKTLAGSFTFSLKAKKSSDSRAGALVDTVMNEVDGMLEKAKSMMAFYANNDGTGVIAAVNDATPNSQTTTTIDSVRGTQIDHIIDVGDSLAAGTSAERTAGTGFGLTVTGIPSGTSITHTETTSGMADDDLIYFSEAYDVSGSAENSKIGADGLLVTTGTVQGIATGSNLYYQAHVDTTAEIVSTTRVLEYLQLADPRMPDSDASMITLGDLWWKLTSLMTGTTQTDSDKMDRLLVAGGRGLRIEWFGGSTPVIHDPYCRPGYVLGLDLNNLGYRQMWPLSLVDDASQLSHRVTQKLEFEVAASEDGNFYVVDPRANFKLTGKTTA